MNIQNAIYKVKNAPNGVEVFKSIQANIDGTIWTVPLDSANTYYAEIMRQVEAGTITIADAD